MELDELLPDIPTPDWKSLRDERAVAEVAFELLKAATIYAHLAAGLLPLERLTRDEAILGGLILKVSKLGKTMITLSAQVGSDRQLVLAREAIEALAILTYLAADTDGTRFEQYVQDGLVAEREFLHLIRKNIKQRGSSWPIEQNMTRSIERTAHEAGIDDVTALPGRRTIGWPSTELLLDGLGPNLYPSYRVGSSILHTRWLDLIRHHLRHERGGTFTLHFEDDRPRAEPFYGVGLLIVDGVRRYLERLRPDALPRFTTGLDQLERDFVRLVHAHSEMVDGSDDNVAG